MNPKKKYRLERKHLSTLLASITQQGYRLIGPTVRDEAIVYEELTSERDLPIGITDIQTGGEYRLEKRSDDAVFGFVVGPHSWKRHLFPPRQRLWSSSKNSKGKFEIEVEETEPVKRAFIGVRACELHAIAVQDKVFMHGPFVAEDYKARRENLFIVGVNCTQPGDACFCASMNTGPKVEFGFDLAMTEIVDGKEHYFVVDVGTRAGADILEHLPHKQAEQQEVETAAKLLEQAGGNMGRQMDTDHIKELLYRNYDNPHWETVAERCLTCGNCTLVCPTCFCNTIEDVTDLTGDHAERWRSWDSCFLKDFSYVHGGSIRTSTAARYRQWMTHKLATWHDQFDCSGCVGCGRCITWCPVAIDITEEARAIRESDAKSKVLTEEKK